MVGLGTGSPAGGTVSAAASTLFDCLHDWQLASPINGFVFADSLALPRRQAHRICHRNASPLWRSFTRLIDECLAERRYLMGIRPHRPSKDERNDPTRDVDQGTHRQTRLAADHADGMSDAKPEEQD